MGCFKTGLGSGVETVFSPYLMMLMLKQNKITALMLELNIYKNIHVLKNQLEIKSSLLLHFVLKKEDYVPLTLMWHAASESDKNTK